MPPRVGDEVLTDYGNARVVNHIPDNAMAIVEPQDSGTFNTVNVASSHDSAMELNVAYESYEKMRKLNLEVECNELGIVFSEDSPIDHDMCTTCLKTNGPQKKVTKSFTAPAFKTPTGKPLFPMLYQLRVESQEFLHASQQNLAQKTKQKETPCLLCGSPTCSKHSSSAFRRENIILCHHCVKSLEFNFENDNHDGLVVAQHAEHLVDLYDRALLLLQYSSQFMLQAAVSLEESKERHNQVGVGSSSAGLVSGVLGIAAAATILTPAGPPLLIASLVFGGSATAVQTGSEAMKYFSEPNKLANRILALQGMLQSILHTTRKMRESTLMPYLDRVFLSFSENRRSPIKSYDDQRSNLQTAMTAGIIGASAATGSARLGTVLVEEGAVASRFMSRATSNLALSARFAQFAGGALSAATLVLEARQLSNTIQQIQKGNPCDKAVALRRIHATLDEMPSTKAIDSICQSYVKVRAKQLARNRLVALAPKPEEEPEGHDLLLVEEVVSSLEAAHHHGAQRPDRYAPTKSRRVDLSKSSLLERVQQFKERESRDRTEVSLVL